MAKRSKQIPTSLHYAGGEDESVLPLWLNAARESKSYERAQELLDQIASVESLAKEAHSVLHSRGRLRELGQIQQKLGKATLLLHRSLNRYQYSPHLFFDRVAGNSHHLSLTSNRSKRNEFAVEIRRTRFIEVGPLPVKISESDVALIICRLAENGRLSKLRRCANENCKKWIFANHAQQRSCPGGTCRQERQNAQRRTSEGRKSRREYMRAYRALPQVKKRSEQRKAVKTSSSGDG